MRAIHASPNHSDPVAALTAIFHEAANPEKARHLMRFFKTGTGQYGYPVPSILRQSSLYARFRDHDELRYLRE